MIINRISGKHRIVAHCLCVCAGFFLKGAALTRCYLRDIHCDITMEQHCVAKKNTHQIGAHGALCQHERTFRHQENLDVGKTRGLLLVVILLRVVGGAAPLGADLVFNLHPSVLRAQGSGSGRVGRHETDERVRSGGEHLGCNDEAALQKKKKKKCECLCQYSL